jgi:predicted transcriptional regulator
MPAAVTPPATPRKRDRAAISARLACKNYVRTNGIRFASGCAAEPAHLPRAAAGTGLASMLFDTNLEVKPMRVRDLMTDAVKTATPSTRLEDVARLMRDEDIGSVPVAENEKLVGMVTDRDIVIRGLAESASLEGKCVRDVMSPQVLYCRVDQTVEDVLKNMGEQQIRRLPVVDESEAPRRRRLAR